jgi:drug/metabolite transporter (DMT)-like permease
MNWKERLLQPGVSAALGAALLFGAGTPLAKLLLNSVSPWLLAGLLYLGSGIGLTLYRRLSRSPAIRLPRAELLWFAGAIGAGGIVGPVLLMLGLRAMPASGASLLLNAEGVFTALLAWFAFQENVDRRVALGMAAIVAGAIVLSWPGLSWSGEARFVSVWPTLAVLGACLAWGIDNNLTRKVSLSNATWIASVKGLAAGSVNLALAFALGAKWPPLPNLAGAMAVGFLAYGVSLALFVVGLRHLGTARTGAYFSVAPFFGAVLAVAIGERVTLPLLIAGALMALGVWLHLTERHSHPHTHEALAHDHEHIHDEHHQHVHAFPVPPARSTVIGISTNLSLTCIRTSRMFIIDTGIKRSQSQRLQLRSSRALHRRPFRVRIRKLDFPRSSVLDSR